MNTSLCRRTQYRSTERPSTERRSIRCRSTPSANGSSIRDRFSDRIRAANKSRVARVKDVTAVLQKAREEELALMDQIVADLKSAIAACADRIQRDCSSHARDNVE